MEREKNIGFDGKKHFPLPCDKIPVICFYREKTEIYLKLCMDFLRITDYNIIDMFHNQNAGYRTSLIRYSIRMVMKIGNEFNSRG